jgi:hypothetical protein
MWKCEAGGPEVGVEELRTLLKHRGGTGRSSGSPSQVARLTRMRTPLVKRHTTPVSGFFFFAALGGLAQSALGLVL